MGAAAAGSLLRAPLPLRTPQHGCAALTRSSCWAMPFLANGVSRGPEPCPECANSCAAHTAPTRLRIGRAGRQPSIRKAAATSTDTVPVACCCPLERLTSVHTMLILYALLATRECAAA